VLPLLATVAAGQELPATPPDYVVDLAGVVDAGAETRLNGYLRDLEQKTGAQFIVLTVRSTDGTPIEDYAVSVFERWKLGKKGRDDGVLLVVAVDDRKAKFEVGYGLEGTLTDTYTGQVARQAMTPRFRQGDYGGGLLEGTLIVANKIAAEAGVQIQGMPQRQLPRSVKPSRGGGFVALVIVIVLLSAIARGAGGRRRRRYGGSIWPWLALDLLMSSRYGGRHWSGGRSGGVGGGGGGFGGGFGGGRGGSSGGGGASFGW
jgi:uncharacterized protein